MHKFNVRYFLTRVALTALLTLGIVIYSAVFIVDSRSDVTTTTRVSTSTRELTVEEKARSEVKHSKQYRFGYLVSETRLYMDGHREIIQGIGGTELILLETAAVGLILMIVFSVIPVFLRRPTAVVLSDQHSVS